MMGSSHVKANIPCLRHPNPNTYTQWSKSKSWDTYIQQVYIPNDPWWRICCRLHLVFFSGECFFFFFAEGYMNPLVMDS